MKSLKSGPLVEQYRDKVYAALEEHCKSKYTNQPGRFAKLLLRLPALRSIGLKCVEHLFFKQLGADMATTTTTINGKKDAIGKLIFFTTSFIICSFHFRYFYFTTFGIVEQSWHLIICQIIIIVVHFILSANINSSMLRIGEIFLSFISILFYFYRFY